MTQETRPLGSVPIWVWGVMAVLIVVAIIAFIQSGQSSSNANAAATAQAQALAAENTAQSQAAAAQVAQNTAVAQVGVAQEAQATAISQAEAAQQSQATAVSQAQQSDATAQAAAEQASAAFATTGTAVSVERMTATFGAVVLGTQTQVVGDLLATNEAQAATGATAQAQLDGMATTVPALLTEQAAQLAQAQTEAANQRSRALAVLSQLNLQTNHPLALLLGVEAYRNQPSAHSNDALITALSAHPEIERYLASPVGDVYALAFSPDGTRLAMGGADTPVVLVDTTTWQPVSPLLGNHFGPVYALAFSGDGRYLASAGSDNNIIIWNLVDGSFRQLIGHTDVVNALSFSADGSRLASVSNDNTVRLWDGMTGEQTGQIELQVDYFSLSLSLSPDGSALAVAQDAAIVLYDTRENREVRRFGAEASGLLTRLMFTPDGKALISGDSFGAVTFWNVRSGEARATLTGDGLSVNDLSLSADGRRMVVVTDSVTVYDISGPAAVEVGRLAQSLTNYYARAALIGDGERVLVSDGALVSLWRLRPESHLYQIIESGDRRVYGVDYSPDGTLLAIGGGANVTIHDATTLAIQHTLPAPDSATPPLFSSDGRYLALGHWDNTVSLWDVSSGELYRTLEGFTGTPLYQAFSPDGLRLTVSDNSGRLSIWRVGTGERLRDFQVADSQSGPGSAPVYSPDGRWLAIASAPNRVSLWDAAAFQPQGEPLIIGSEFNRITALAFSPDNQTVVVSGFEGQVVAFDVNSRQPRHTWNLLPAMPLYAVFFAGENRFVLASDTQIYMLDALTGEGALQFTLSDSEVVFDVALAPDGSALLIASDLMGTGRVVRWSLNPEDWIERACAVAGRNLTWGEWQQNMGDQPYAKVCDSLPVERSVIQHWMDEADALANSGDQENARLLYQQATAAVLETVNADQSNLICWRGSLHGFAADVLPACDHAAALVPASGYVIDSRGLARALTGDTAGAIADFQLFVEWSRAYGVYDTQGVQREGWIEQLKAGENPFTPEVLEELYEQ